MIETLALFFLYTYNVHQKNELQNPAFEKKEKRWQSMLFVP